MTVPELRSRRPRPGGALALVAPLVAVVAAVAALARPGVARAQQEGELPATFSSDRPGFANTSAVAARERVTTELGVAASFGDVSIGSLPSLSLRAGLLDWLEARVRGPDAIGVFEGGEATFGLADPLVGFKIGGSLHETLAISLVWEVSLPVGTDGFGAPEADWFADLNIDWSFWGPLTLTPNLVASVLSARDEGTGEVVRYFRGGGSLKLTWQVIDVLSVFVQSYALASEIEDWSVWAGGGLMWMVAPNVQVDASVDTLLTRQGEPTVVGLGTTILW